MLVGVPMGVDRDVGRGAYGGGLRCLRCTFEEREIWDGY